MLEKLKQKPKLIALAALPLLVLSTTITLTVIGGLSPKMELAESAIEPQILGTDLAEPESTELPDNLNALTVLLLGYGGPGHDGPYLADVIQLVHVDFETAQVSLISIPRDLWVSLPNGQQAKINSALMLGNDKRNLVASGGPIAKQMAETVTGLKVDYFIGIDFVGFKRAIGIELKGIEVNVGETLDDSWYPIAGEEQNPCGKSPEEIAELTARYSGSTLERQFPCRYERVYFKPGKTKMEGGEALAYVRSRHGSAGGDFSRSRRQHEVLLAIRNKAMSIEGVKVIPRLFKQLAVHSTTDISVEIAEQMGPALKQAGNYEVKTIVLSTDNVFASSRSSSGQSILIPREGMGQWGSVRSFIEKEMADR
jgi:polyisoprenyl-teichoic acid--peptidoglycan teichoic acid transferase